eukprot:TRINITY_DN37768_c0_g1_i1.p1 TRINITY_DN37768_c0_g1~~TRINITY_DN37768_c0_g1_i1.p1  ORF type:complete len:306 (+),score=47.77 TRINITY_DN37768_c0_g1_i1:58-918(+)
MATRERVNAVENARVKGKLSPAERKTLMEKIGQLEETELEEEIQRLEAKLKRDVYVAAECKELLEPYSTLQTTRDQLFAARTIKFSRMTGEGGEKYASVVRIQCLCRAYLAGLAYRKKLELKRSSFVAQLTTDDLNESVLVIQGVIRQKLARNELDRRRSTLYTQHVAISGNSSFQDKVSRPESQTRSLPLDEGNAQLLPYYTIHDVSGVPLSEEDLTELFNSLDSGPKGYLTKSEFKNFYATLDSYGVPEPEGYVDDLLRPYTVLGDDKLTYDEFVIVMLKLSQR